MSLNAVDLPIISGQVAENSVECHENISEAAIAKNLNFKEPESLSVVSLPTISNCSLPCLEKMTSSNSSISGDLHDISLSPLFTLPVGKTSCSSDSNFSSSGHLPAHNILIGQYTGKMSSSKCFSTEYVSQSLSVVSSGSINSVHSDFTNVEEWLKHKTDSLSSFEFDTEVKSETDVTDVSDTEGKSEVDINDLLSLKTSSRNSLGLNDVNYKLAQDIGHYALGRPVTPTATGLLNSLNFLPEHESSTLTTISSHDVSKPRISSSLKRSELMNLQVDKGIFEESLLPDILKKNLKAKDLHIDEKGLFEELLLPGVQEWLLTVSAIDKKDSTGTVPLMETVPTLAESSVDVVDDHIDDTSSNKEAFNEYDLIGRNVNNLRLLTPHEIENLPSKTLELDGHSKSEDTEEETIKQLTDLPSGATIDVDNKLFNILAMDASSDTAENNIGAVHEIESNNETESLDKSVSPDQFIIKSNSDKENESISNVNIQSVPVSCGSEITESLLFAPKSQSESELHDYSESDFKLSDNAGKTISNQNESCAKEAILPVTNACLSDKLISIINKQQGSVEAGAVHTESFIATSHDITDAASATFIPNSAKPVSLVENSSDSRLLVIHPSSPLDTYENDLQSSPVTKKSVVSSSPKGSNELQVQVLRRSSVAGIAKVNISVNCSLNLTKVSIISSNKEHTLFKINTSDMLCAISSIKEHYLEPLGLKSQQLMATANAASKLLKVHSQVSAASFNNNIKNAHQILPPQNFEVNQLIQEVKAPVTKSKQVHATSTIKTTDSPVVPSAKSSGSTSKRTMRKVTSLFSKQQIKPKFCENKKIITKSHRHNMEKSRMHENVGISLLPRAPPTMVSVPSVLDALSGPTTSKINIANVLANCETNEQKEKNVKEDETTQASDEKTNSALLQLGFDPCSLVSDSDPDGGKKWTCPISSCSKHYPKLSYLKVHILTHKGIRPYKCSYENCDWSFYTSYKLKRHLETHLKRRDYVCREPDCNRRFTTVYNLNTHMTLHQRPKTWICSLPSCKSSFHTRRKLEAHMKIHTDANPPYKCTVEGCSKAYFTPNSLASHTRGHHKDEDIRCQWSGCGKKFDKPCRLKAHMRAHTGQRPFACNFEGCNWRFHCASKLSRHQRKHTNDRKYTCPICKKAFLRSEHLKGHLLTHTGVRNFQCPLQHCDAKFTAKSSLYVHLKKHRTAGAKFPCPFTSCDIAVDSKLHLRQHLMKSHSPLLDTNQLDYVTLVNDKEIVSESGQSHLTTAISDSVLPSRSQSSYIPLSHQSASLHASSSTGMQITPSGVKVPCSISSGAGDNTLTPLLAMSSGIGLVESQSESSMPLFVSDSLLHFGDIVSSQNVTDFGFPELSTKDTGGKNSSKGMTFQSGTSARTDALGNLILSQRAKQRQQINLARKLAVASSEIPKVSFCNEFSLSSSVGDALPTNFQPVLMQDDGMSAALYQDLLTDPTNDPQSTINLRDLE